MWTDTVAWCVPISDVRLKLISLKKINKKKSLNSLRLQNQVSCFCGQQPPFSINSHSWHFYAKNAKTAMGTFHCDTTGTNFHQPAHRWTTGPVRSLSRICLAQKLSVFFSPADTCQPSQVSRMWHRANKEEEKPLSHFEWKDEWNFSYNLFPLLMQSMKESRSLLWILDQTA